MLCAYLINWPVWPSPFPVVLEVAIVSELRTKSPSMLFFTSDTRRADMLRMGTGHRRREVSQLFFFSMRHMYPPRLRLRPPRRFVVSATTGSQKPCRASLVKPWRGLRLVWQRHWVDVRSEQSNGRDDTWDGRRECGGQIAALIGATGGVEVEDEDCGRVYKRAGSTT